MLAAPHRLRESAQFAAVTRGRGSVRAGGPLLTVHLARTVGSPTDAPLPRAGFVVSRSVGTAVIRNRTKRRLRAQTAALLERLPSGVDMVVRARPAAGQSSSADLASELGGSLDRALERLSARGRR